MTKVLSEAQQHFRSGCVPGSIMSDMDLATRRAFKQWLKELDADRHCLERQLRWNGAIVTSGDRFGQA